VSRILTFLYGLLSYAVFLVVFLYAIGFVGGFWTPTALDAAPRKPLTEALLINLGLLVAFALQHSGMARPAFKRWWTKFVPEPAERATYVLFSSLAMVALFVLWEPIGGVVWETEGAVRSVVIGVYLLGWAILLYSTFLIDHFDLFGLTQVWRALTGQQYQSPQFRTPSLYKIVRHPLYIGWLTIFWAAPIMTVAHLIFAVVTTLYILVAIRLEERDLEDAFGATYADYKRRTPMLLPGLGGSRRPAGAPTSTR
jgi:protein-S-isoprenylcysteine O-methyltransferase Ste14